MILSDVSAGTAFSWPTGWTVAYVQPDHRGHTQGPVQTGTIAGQAEISPQTGRVMVPVRSAMPPESCAWVRETDIIRLTPPRQSSMAA